MATLFIFCQIFSSLTYASISLLCWNLISVTVEPSLSGDLKNAFSYLIKEKKFYKEFHEYFKIFIIFSYNSDFLACDDANLAAYSCMLLHGCLDRVRGEALLASSLGHSLVSAVLQLLMKRDVDWGYVQKGQFVS